MSACAPIDQTEPGMYLPSWPRKNIAEPSTMGSRASRRSISRSQRTAVAVNPSITSSSAPRTLSTEVSARALPISSNRPRRLSQPKTTTATRNRTRSAGRNLRSATQPHQSGPGRVGEGRGQATGPGDLDRDRRGVDGPAVALPVDVVEDQDAVRGQSGDGVPEAGVARPAVDHDQVVA